MIRFQALAFFLGRNLPRDARVIHGRHVDQETSRQRDVARDACALLANGFLGDLDQNLLPFLEKVGDQRYRSRLAAPEAASPTAAASAIATLSLVARAAVSRAGPLRALRIASGRSRSSNFRAGVDRAISASLRVQHGLSLRLSLFQFQFFGVFLFGRRPLNRMRVARFSHRSHVNFRHRLPGVAVQMHRLTSCLCLLFKLLVPFVRRSLVVNRVCFFLFDGFFFHRAGGGEYRCFVFSVRTFRLLVAFRSGCYRFSILLGLVLRLLPRWVSVLRQSTPEQVRSSLQGGGTPGPN